MAMTSPLGAAPRQIAALALVLGALLPAPGRAAEEDRRTVAVLEYRNAATQAQDLAGRIGEALSRNTSLQVIDPREGRRRLGARIDGEVAACAGEGGCLAQIGGRLGAREVLLLAVSQLGDLVLAIQRIDVEKKAVVGRVADSIPAGQGLDEARILSWLQQLYPPETFKRYGRIHLRTDVAGAQIYVNTKARGQTPLPEPIQVLAPGNYRVLVEKPRFLPFQATISVMPDTTVEVTAPLVPESTSRPWYRRWYVWTAIGGAAALAAGSVALAATLSREPPDMTRLPGTIEIR